MTTSRVASYTSRGNMRSPRSRPSGPTQIFRPSSPNRRNFALEFKQRTINRAQIEDEHLNAAEQAALAFIDAADRAQRSCPPTPEACSSILTAEERTQGMAIYHTMDKDGRGELSVDRLCFVDAAERTRMLKKLDRDHNNKASSLKCPLVSILSACVLHAIS